MDFHLKSLELKLLFTLSGQHPSQFLFRIDKERFSKYIFHLLMNGQAESTDLHLPDIPRLTLRLPGGLTAQDSRIRIKSLVCDDSLIVFLRKFSYILQHVATGIRTTSLVKLLLRVI